MKHYKSFSSGSDATVAQTLVGKAIRLGEFGDVQQALAFLSNGNSVSQEVINARAVCLMRIGRTTDAIRILRSLMLPSGCTWMNPDLPVIYRTNFSTALLLEGLALGARNTLIEIKEKEHPSVVRLRNSVLKWENSLSWWQRLCWRMCLPPDAPIMIDFVPGEFVDRLSIPVVTPPAADPSFLIPNHQVA